MPSLRHEDRVPNSSISTHHPCIPSSIPSIRLSHLRIAIEKQRNPRRQCRTAFTFQSLTRDKATQDAQVSKVLQPAPMLQHPRSRWTCSSIHTSASVMRSTASPYLLLPFEPKTILTQPFPSPKSLFATSTCDTQMGVPIFKSLT